MRNKTFPGFVLILLCCFSGIFSEAVLAQCTETNPAGCSCPTPGSTNCILLPDILAGKKTLNATTGWTEYSQGISTVDKGLIRLDVATPNVGWGPCKPAPPTITSAVPIP
ncbi:MAG: hypothetical protein IPI66_13450 [Chitinophagaceae bacterium]|nr:hypothetical protein [Chitinophagaceae bacterium]